MLPKAGLLFAAVTRYVFLRSIPTTNLRKFGERWWLSDYSMFYFKLGKKSRSTPTARTHPRGGEYGVDFKKNGFSLSQDLCRSLPVWFGPPFPEEISPDRNRGEEEKKDKGENRKRIKSHRVQRAEREHQEMKL